MSTPSRSPRLHSRWWTRSTTTSTTTSPPLTLSLREAIDLVQLAGVNAPVTFAPGLHGTIDLSLGTMAVIGDVAIQGPGADALTIDAGGRSEIFEIGDRLEFNNVCMSGLTLTGQETEPSGMPGI